MNPNTNVLLYFGGTKKIKDLVRGDILLGFDNNSKIVSNNITDEKQCYNIIPSIGEIITISIDSMITVYSEENHYIIDLPIKNLLKYQNIPIKNFKLVNNIINYNRQETKNNPYLVGILLGNPESDNKKLETLNDFTKGKTDLKLLSQTSTINNEEIHDLLNLRYIPDSYLYNDKQTRTEILKGIIESNIQYIENKHHIAELEKMFVKTPGSSRRSRSVGGSGKQNVTSNHKRSKSVVKSSMKQPNTPKSPSKYKVTFGSGRNKSISEKKNSREKRHSMINTNNLNNSNNSNNLNNLNTINIMSGPINISSTDSITSTQSNIETKRTSRLKTFQSRIPKLSRVNHVLNIHDKKLAEQIRFLSRSLGHKCIYVDNELTIYIQDSTNYTLVDFKIEKAKVETVNEISIISDNNRFILNSCIVVSGTCN